MSRMNSGMIITTGGTIISAVDTVEERQRPGSASGRSRTPPSAAIRVASVVEPTAKIVEFANQRPKLPPRVASLKFSQWSGQGKPRRAVRGSRPVP